MDYHIFERINTILSYLEDEESKMTFLQRFLYNASGDISYIFDIIKYSKIFNINQVVEKYKEVQEKYHIYPEMDLISFIKANSKNNEPVIVFGCGDIGKNVYRLLDNAGIQIECFCDNHKAGETFFGKKIINSRELQKDYSKSLIVIATMNYQQEIYDQLLALKFKKDKIYYPSQNMFISFFSTPYFDKDIFKPEKGEVFIDGGCYGAETSADFITWCPDYKKIYAFEPDNENIEKCRAIIKEKSIRDMELYHAGLWSSNGTLSFTHSGDEGAGSYIEDEGEQTIQVMSIDQALDGKEVTFIKMDIEGAELEALKGAKDTIQKYLPKMAICIYHKPEDIFEIPEYIKSIVPEYKLSIRHYSTYLYDTVLYCWV